MQKFSGDIGLRSALRNQLYWTHWVLEQAGSSAGPARTEWIDTGPPRWLWTPCHYRTRTAARWWYWTDTELRKDFIYVLQMSYIVSLLKRLSNFLLQMGIVVFYKCYSNWSKKWICWGLFSSVDELTLGVLVSTAAGRCVFIVVK